MFSRVVFNWLDCCLLWHISSLLHCQNGGKYNFILDNGVGLPVQQEFWDFLLSSSKKQWGLMVYEQDWLDYTGSVMPATYVSVVSLGDSDSELSTCNYSLLVVLLSLADTLMLLVLTATNFKIIKISTHRILDF